MSGLAEEVWPQIVARYPGFVLNLINAGQGNGLLCPSGDGRFVDFALAGEINQAKALGFQKIGQGDLHAATVAQLATKVKRLVAQGTNDMVACRNYLRRMSRRPRQSPTRIYRGRQPRRPHFIREWAERRGYETQADLVEALGADKSVVSRWYDGATPGEEWQEKLVALFHCEEPDGIFRHPDDDWLAKFFRDRSEEEIDRAKTMLEAAFPRKTQHNQ